MIEMLLRSRILLHLLSALPDVRQEDSVTGLRFEVSMTWQDSALTEAREVPERGNDTEIGETHPTTIPQKTPIDQELRIPYSPC